MFSIANQRVTRSLIFVLPALFLAGCFGQGEGPTPIAGTPAPPPPDVPPGFCDPINFEDVCGPFVFTEFEGGPVTIIDNPDVNALNPTDKVARMQKFAAESGLTFGGSTLALPGGMDFSNGEAFRMLVWASRPVPLIFKFEGLNEERELTHSGSGGWEELCFDFTGTAVGGPAATGITFIFDVTVLGDAANDPDNWTFYFDEITQDTSCGAGGPPPGGSAPTTSAPTPTQDAGSVISLYSDAYTDEAVVWPTDWSDPNNTTSDVTIDGGLVKEALDISFFGIEFQVDGSSMTHLHVDVWTPDATSLLLKLVDFGGDGFGGGNDTEGLLTFDAASTPALQQGTWVSLDIPLQDFLDNGLASVADLNQIVVDPGPDGTDLYIDNVYFYDGNAGGGGATAPTTSAPTPTQDAANVISLYSDAYTDLATTWPTPWSDPNNTTSDVTIDGGLVKEHLAINFVGVEFQTDASSMTHVHFDVWTPDATSLLFRLVDFGGDGFGGGNDTQADVTLDAASTPALAQGAWVSVDIPLQTFLDNGLASVADLNQIVLDPTADGSTVYIDNVYFYDDNAGGGGNAPTTSAPTPTQDAGSVISLYSDAYTDLATTWPTTWSVPNNTTSDVTIDGGLVKEHLGISFVGVEFQTDASSMTHVHFDVWTPDATSLLFRLVDFGGDGFGGGNDTQADVTLDATSTPALVQGSWVSVDIPLQTFLDNGLGSVADLNQIVLDPTADGSAVYIDNVYFYTDTPPTSPTTSAPTPTQDAANVISLYSDAYTDLATTWPTTWSVPNNTTSDVTIDGGLVKEHLGISFVGVEFQTDASSMTHVHFDVWTPDATSLLFRLVDFGGDGFGGMNPDTSADVILDNASTPALAQGSWVSVDIPLQTFLDNGLGSVADLNQIVIDPTADGSTVYIDNVYFYNDVGGGTGGTFVNGDFETGDFTGWTLTQIPDTRGSIALDSSGLGGRAGTVARLVAAGDATGTNDVLISQVALAAGTIAAGDTIDVSFDLYGSLTGAGGVVFVEVIFLNGAGLDEGGRDFVGPAAPYTPTTTWTTHSGSVTAGTAVDGSQWDVSGGVTLQLKAACGAIAGGCGVDAAFDNVTFTINGP